VHAARRIVAGRLGSATVASWRNLGGKTRNPRRDWRQMMNGLIPWLNHRGSPALLQQLQNGRHEIGAQHRIAPLVAAALYPIFEAVLEHKFTLAGLALYAKLQLADRTTHQPSAMRRIPCRSSPPWPRTRAEHKARASNVHVK